MNASVIMVKLSVNSLPRLLSHVQSVSKNVLK